MTKTFKEFIEMTEMTDEERIKTAKELGQREARRNAIARKKRNSWIQGGRSEKKSMNTRERRRRIQQKLYGTSV